MNNKLIILMSSLLLSGCVSSQSVQDALSNKYQNKSMDSFVLANSPPASKYTLSSGDYVYSWNPGTASMPMPTTASTTYNGGTANTVVTGGGSIDMSCELLIVTSSDDVIKSIKIKTDTIGFWTTSRCHEIVK